MKPFGPDSARHDEVRTAERRTPAGAPRADSPAAQLTDGLTGLASRTLLERRLRLLPPADARSARRLVAVLVIDLDNFKYVNDSLGHLAGDHVLIETARRLTDAVRGDARTAALLSLPAAVSGPVAARFSGDEFVVLLDDVTSVDHVLTTADRIQRAITSPIRIGRKAVTMRCSIGVAMAGGGSSHGPRPDLLRDAGTAMHHAKTSGKASIVAFNEPMHEAASRRLRIEADLCAAVDAGEIEAVYQPIVHLETGRVVSFEALARWQHRELGAISPEEFIPIAEETGLVVPLAHGLLCRSIELLERLSREPGGEEVRINVNVSRRQLADATFLPTLESLVRGLTVAPRRLCLEITESMAMASPETVRGSLAAIKALGVQIHMDDFGTGLSSLSLLRTLPLDGIKVDRSFIEAAEDREAIAILHAIITLGRNLRKVTTAEGLETTTHMATVLALECDLAQGFLLGRPVEAADAPTLLTVDFSSRVAIGRALEDAREREVL